MVSHTFYYSRNQQNSAKPILYIYDGLSASMVDIWSGLHWWDKPHIIIVFIPWPPWTHLIRPSFEMLFSPQNMELSTKLSPSSVFNRYMYVGLAGPW